MVLLLSNDIEVNPGPLQKYNIDLQVCHKCFSKSPIVSGTCQSCGSSFRNRRSRSVGVSEQDCNKPSKNSECASQTTNFVSTLCANGKISTIDRS